MKILFNKKDSALVQMREPSQAQLGEFVVMAADINLKKNTLNIFFAFRHSPHLPGPTPAPFKTAPRNHLEAHHSADAQRRAAGCGVDKRLHIKSPSQV